MRWNCFHYSDEETVLESNMHKIIKVGHFRDLWLLVWSSFHMSALAKINVFGSCPQRGFSWVRKTQCLVLYVSALIEPQSYYGISEVEGIKSIWLVWGRLHGGVAFILDLEKWASFQCKGRGRPLQAEGAQRKGTWGVCWRWESTRCSLDVV